MFTIIIVFFCIIIFFFFFIVLIEFIFFFFFSSRRRHTRCLSDWSSDVCSSDLGPPGGGARLHGRPAEAGVRRFVLCTLLIAPAVSGAEPSAKAMRPRIDAILARGDLAAAFWGVEVRSLPSGRVLYAQNAEKSLTPASTMKLVTTAAALDAFGPDLRLRTTVETSGRLDGLGRVLGDVYLVGRGDANLSGRFSDGKITAPFEALADQLWAAGVRRVEGRLIGHEG